MRCCSDDNLSGFSQNSHYGCPASVYGASYAWTEGCAHNKNFAQAAAICEGVNARLCTVAELEADCTRGTGCGFDAQLVWASP